MPHRLPAPCLVVLIGPSGSGKTTWARDNFAANQVVTSDALRAMVGESEFDQKAGRDAFEVLDDIVRRRLDRGLVTVVDTLGLEPDKRNAWSGLATELGIPTYAVLFDTPAKECRERNKRRERPVPERVLNRQIKRFASVRNDVEGEGFAAVLTPEPVRVVPAAQLQADAAALRQAEDPVALRFELQLNDFSWLDRPENLGPRLAEIAAAGEAAGFGGIWVMDHFRQIPQVGREWEPMPESYTVLSYLAAVTRTARLGVLVTGVTYRNPAHLGKIAATLDVLSGGRAVCGVGLGWFEQEHRAYGWPFPSVAERYDLLEDTLQLLPLLWGPGSPSFEGKVLSASEAMCYPRPIQDPIPILLGGSGETRTLRLVAEYADACNLFGDPATIRHKVAVLHGHCADVDRDPAAIEVTNLTRAFVAADESDLKHKIERTKPAGVSAERFAAAVNAGTVDDQIGRYREYAEAGVQTAIITMPDAHDPAAIATFARVIDAFNGSSGARSQ